METHVSEAPSGVGLMTRAASTPSTGDSGRPGSDGSFRPRTNQVTPESQLQAAAARREIPSFDISGISPIRPTSRPGSNASSLVRGDGRGSLRVRFNTSQSSAVVESRRNTQTGSTIAQRRGTPHPQGRPSSARDRRTGQITAESLALMDFESSGDNSTNGASQTTNMPGTSGGGSSML